MTYYNIEDFKYDEDKSPWQNFERLKRALDILPKPAEIRPINKHTSNFSGNWERYESIYYGRFIESFDKSEKLVNGPNSDEEEIKRSVKSTFRNAFMLFAILVAKDVTTYSPNVVAELWLQEDYTIKGSSVHGELLPEICAHLHCGGYDLSKMVQANWYHLKNLIDLENVFRNIFINYKRKEYAVMDAKTRDWFDALDDEFTVYRGCYKNFTRGTSWTTSKEVAEKYEKNRTPEEGNDAILVKTTIKKTDVLCASNKNNEFEIIHNPDKCEVYVV
jgi:hypothetical protein